MKNDNFFAIHELLEIAELDAKEGIAKNGQDRYFFYLNLFLETGRTLFTTYTTQSIDTEFDIMAEKFESFRAVVLKMHVKTMTDELEKLIANLKSGDIIEAKAHFCKLAAQLEDLYNKIILTIIYKSPDGKVFKIDEPPLKTKAAESARKSTEKLPLDVSTLKHIITLVNDFQLVEAQSEVERIRMTFYGGMVERYLDDLTSSLKKFDISASNESIKNILGAISSKSAAAKEKAKILAVDDNIGVLNTLKAMLKEKYDVFTIPDPKVVFRFLLAHEVDCILLDIEMPDMDGYEVISEIRKMIKHAQTPVIFLTANTAREYIEKALKYGANDFIAKPVDLNTLLKKIEKQINKAQ